MRTYVHTLSVSSTTTTSSTSTDSPGCFVHSTMVPSVMESPMLGTETISSPPGREDKTSQNQRQDKSKEHGIASRQQEREAFADVKSAVCLCPSPPRAACTRWTRAGTRCCDRSPSARRTRRWRSSLERVFCSAGKPSSLFRETAHPANLAQQTIKRILTQNHSTSFVFRQSRGCVST